MKKSIIYPHEFLAFAKAYREQKEEKLPESIRIVRIVKFENLTEAARLIYNVLKENLPNGLKVTEICYYTGLNINRVYKSFRDYPAAFEYLGKSKWSINSDALRYYEVGPREVRMENSSLQSLDGRYDAKDENVSRTRICPHDRYEVAKVS